MAFRVNDGIGSSVSCGAIPDVRSIFYRLAYSTMYDLFFQSLAVRLPCSSVSYNSKRLKVRVPRTLEEPSLLHYLVRLAAEFQKVNIKKSGRHMTAGPLTMKNWVGRIRTYECWSQSPVPYRLATTQYLSFLTAEP